MLALWRVLVYNKWRHFVPPDKHPPHQPNATQNAVLSLDDYQKAATKIGHRAQAFRDCPIFFTLPPISFSVPFKSSKFLFECML
jgi:hypothetical protein